MTNNAENQKLKIDKEKLGMRRNKKTEGSETFEPENKEKQERSFPKEAKLFEQPKRKLTTKELPKSVRLSVETHTAISTLATIEDMKIYEVINMLIEEKVAALPTAKQKLVKNAVKQVLELKKNQG
ncbi:hypothetical protein U9R71_26210 [Bacillus toyonensis]|uniref:hypothetical protein n=1 Tax=Bacillus toyonensis TaxID=155322 RepID=UPI0018D1064A|nr:hypothetical protein [Bacillus toyonensis]MBH0357714.1 hypothetical protein [Bacillus toyonensis biovar Thuringiensis]